MSKTTTLTIRVDETMKKRLEHTAKLQRRSKAFVAVEALEEYLAVQEWQEARIRKALTSADSGKGIPHDDVRDWVASWDTENELGMPKA